MSNSFSSEPRRYLIAIGSPYCPNMKLSQLNSVESDIKRVTKLFKEQQHYEIVLSDQIPIGATSQRIKSNVVSWFSDANRKSSDCVVVYYAGHGDEVGKFGEHYLFTVESNLEELLTTAISTEEFAKSFFQGDQSRTPQNILLILDTCYANAGGQQISQVLSKLKDVALEGSGFWVICSSDANTEAGDGAFVEALCAVMDHNRKEFQQDGEFISIETLVGRINEHFKTTGQAQRALADSRKIGQETTFFRNPRYVTPDDASPQLMPEQRNWCSQLVDCLCSLDYRPQTRVFEDCTCRARHVAAFVVQARDTRIQRWLVKRLFNQLPNVRNARVFPFVIPAHPLWKLRDFDELWSDFAKRLRCDSNSRIVLDELVKIYQTKPVIVAMYDWQVSRRSQQLQTQVLTEFWQPLVQAIRDLPNQPSRSRLVLFLAEGATRDPEVVDDVNLPIRLAPLTEIIRDEVADWLDSQRVSPVLQQVQSEDVITRLIEQEIGEWDADPVQTIQEICYVFDLENGIADIESEWRLMG